MVLRRYSASKIWSSNCIQDIVRTGITLINIVTRFLYQICLIDKMFRTQRRTKDPVKHLNGALSEYSYRRKSLNYFYKKLHLRSLNGVLNTPLEYLKLNAI